MERIQPPPHFPGAKNCLLPFRGKQASLTHNIKETSQVNANRKTTKKANRVKRGPAARAAGDPISYFFHAAFHPPPKGLNNTLDKSKVCDAEAFRVECVHRVDGRTPNQPAPRSRLTLPGHGEHRQ